MHQGLSLENGHYTFIDLKTNELISDDIILPVKKIDGKDIYMVIYEECEDLNISP